MRRRCVLTLVVLIGACGGQTLTGPTGDSLPAALPPATVAAPPPLPPGLPQVFVGAGDIAMCDANSEGTARLLDGTGGTVFTLGDNAYFSGTSAEFRDCYQPTWGRHKSRTRPVAGNHDYASPDAGPYFDYFGASAGPRSLGYYSFDIGAWHAVALNSNIDVNTGSAQAEWLRADLSASGARCTIAYWHHPLFSSGPDGDSPRMRGIWRILYDAGAEIVMNGHEHFYERFAPQDADGAGDAARGIRQFIAGTGGAALYQPVTVRANSDLRISVFGVLKLTLAANGYDWEFITAGGRRDSGSGTCH